MTKYIKAANGREALKEIITRLNNNVYPKGYRSLEHFELNDNDDVSTYLHGFQHDDKLELKLEKEGENLYLVWIYARSK